MDKNDNYPNRRCCDYSGVYKKGEAVFEPASAKTHYMAIRIRSQTGHRMILKGLGEGVCH